MSNLQITNLSAGTDQIRASLSEDQARVLFSKMLSLVSRDAQDRKEIIEWSKELCDEWYDFAQFAIGQIAQHLIDTSQQITQETIDCELKY